MRLPKLLDRSVALRTTILVLGIVTVIMLVAGLWQINYMREIVTEETHRQASRSMESAIKVLDNRVSNVETAVNTAASYAYMMAPHEVLGITLLQRLIEANEDIAAVTLMYKADYFPNHGRYYAPTISRDPITGALEEDEIGGPENDFCYLETDSNWVYSNKLDAGYWCLPYIDSMSTKRAMVSYSVPLHDEKGETYAILCADVDLRWVQQIVESAKPYDYSEVFILGRDSQFVCHPDIQWIQTHNAITQLEKRKSEEASILANKMLRGGKGVDTVSDLSLFTSSATQKNSEASLVFYAPVSRVQWSVCFTIPESKIMEQPNRLQHSMLFLLIILLLVIGIVLRRVIHLQLFPLKTLAHSASEVAKGDFHAELPAIKTQDEIRELRDSFENMQISLTQYIDQLQMTTASKAAIENELKVAHDIQMSMLPKTFPPYPERDDVDIYGKLTPAKDVGGDLFDFNIRDEKLFFCIGDVSGKGVPASLVMAVTRSLFRNISLHVSEPNVIVEALNESIAKGNEQNMFVTLFLGVLDLHTGVLQYCNAGHNSPLLIGRDVRTLDCDPNLPVGAFDGWAFTLQEIQLEPQTTIFLYTDGLNEAEDSAQAQFGEERMLRVAEKQIVDGALEPVAIVSQMEEAVHRFVGDAEQSDDLTMLAIQYRHS
ncbi:MAG: SpoIIE family protein phosphatase [Prevotella sp.]|nr:SpoIIE family protein phosphatase [Prevotella sp.]